MIYDERTDGLQAERSVMPFFWWKMISSAPEVHQDPFQHHGESAMWTEYHLRVRQKYFQVPEEVVIWNQFLYESSS